MNRRQKIFWLVVKDCMVVCHDLHTMTAEGRISDLFNLIKDHDNATIYDEDPFRVACAIADKDLDFNAYLKDYLIILTVNRFTDL